MFKQNNFNNTNEIKSLFPSCSFVGENRVVFNISGNKYRLVVYVRYDIQIVYIRFIGTHAEYDKIKCKGDLIWKYTLSKQKKTMKKLLSVIDMLLSALSGFGRG